MDLVSAGADGHLRAYQRRGGVPDLLIGVGNVVTRGQTEITYKIWANGVDTPGTCVYPVACPIIRGSVVASLQDNLGLRTERRGHLGHVRARVHRGTSRSTRPRLAWLRRTSRYPGWHQLQHSDGVRQRDP